jgi:hypothetical protein
MPIRRLRNEAYERTGDRAGLDSQDDASPVGQHHEELEAGAGHRFARLRAWAYAGPRWSSTPGSCGFGIL